MNCLRSYGENVTVHTMRKLQRNPAHFKWPTARGLDSLAAFRTVSYAFSVNENARSEQQRENSYLVYWHVHFQHNDVE